MVCKQFHSKVIEGEIITGTHIGDRVFIPRITFIPTTFDFPFEMRRRQFPVKLAFGMTLNKSQGQTLNTFGLYLATPIFSHGKLYGDDLRNVENADRNCKTTLTEWFIANQLHGDAHDLLYIDFPTKWVWNKTMKTWTRRKHGNTIG